MFSPYIRYVFGSELDNVLHWMPWVQPKPCCYRWSEPTSDLGSNAKLKLTQNNFKISLNIYQSIKTSGNCNCSTILYFIQECKPTEEVFGMIDNNATFEPFQSCFQGQTTHNCRNLKLSICRNFKNTRNVTAESFELFSCLLKRYDNVDSQFSF